MGLLITLIEFLLDTFIFYTFRIDLKALKNYMWALD